MICYVLAIGKQHLGPRVVLGPYGIKSFWPRLFITSPDHLVCLEFWLLTICTSTLHERQSAHLHLVSALKYCINTNYGKYMYGTVAFKNDRIHCSLRCFGTVQSMMHKGK